MSAPERTHLILGLIIAVAAIALVAIWIPADTASGLIERVRRQTIIGDALAPTVAGGFLILGGLMLALFERAAPSQPRPDRTALVFIGKVALILALGFLAMRYLGPLAVWIANTATGDTAEYRLLRNTAPWKYLGFAIGGTWIVAGLIALVERRLHPRSVVVAICAVIVLIAIFDLPFDDLLLPPNGDV